MAKVGNPLGYVVQARFLPMAGIEPSHQIANLAACLPSV